MTWQYIIVGIIVSSAMLLTAIRLVRFFRTPPSKCHGCSGCALKEVTRDT